MYWPAYMKQRDRNASAEDKAAAEKVLAEVEQELLFHPGRLQRTRDRWGPTANLIQLRRGQETQRQQTFEDKSPGHFLPLAGQLELLAGDVTAFDQTRTQAHDPTSILPTI